MNLIVKDALRIEARQHLDRLAVSDTDAEKAAELFRSVISTENRVISAYWPLGKEFDVRPIIDDVLKTGGKIALPVASRENRVMRFAFWDGKAALVKGEFGIYVPPAPEFVDPDIVIVPLLAFDRKGNRLGKGAGHYDATLAHLRARKKILAVGAAHAGQAVLFGLPAESHDEKLDMIVTPEGVHDFRI